MDLFGRHSALSDAAPWYQALPPDHPPPWYYQVDGNDPPASAGPNLNRVPVDFTPRSRYAVALLDDTPPPAPVNVSAHYLDPDDPHVQQDELYQQWRHGQTDTAPHGIRVQWSWPYQFLNLLPETRPPASGPAPLQFALYVKLAEVNALLGEVLEVSDEDSNQARILVGFVDTPPSGTYRGATLRADHQSYRIIDAHPLSNTPFDLDYRVLTSPQPIAPARLTLVASARVRSQ
jgi:hypothetical protein